LDKSAAAVFILLEAVVAVPLAQYMVLAG